MSGLTTLPLAAAQGMWVRHRVERLPEADGALAGVAGDGEPVTRLVVVGESTAAGCGAPTHDRGFAGALARRIAARDASAVRWTVVARNGATIAQVHADLLPQVHGPVDLAVVMIGVNDVLTRTPVTRWSRDLRSVLSTLTARSNRVVLTGLPPFTAFPILPRALAGYLAGRAARLDESARAVCAGLSGVTWSPSVDLGLTPALFARDGFHPSPQGYDRWASAVHDGLGHRG